MILPLETFRGIFALIIVLHHLKIDTFIQKSSIVINGGLVVDFFFVLSGFVISLNYIDKINSKLDLINFQKKRFLRLYPLHLLTLFIFILIEIIKILVENYLDLQPTYSPFSGFNNYYWIGMFQDSNSVEPDGDWQLLDGTTPTYFNWNTGEPNNSANEDVVHFNFQNGGPKWNDAQGFTNVDSLGSNGNRQA